MQYEFLDISTVINYFKMQTTFVEKEELETKIRSKKDLYDLFKYYSKDLHLLIGIIIYIKRRKEQRVKLLIQKIKLSSW